MKLMNRSFSILAAALALAGPLGAQTGPVIFQRLHGEWQGTGTLLGRSAQFEMRWDNGRAFATLIFANAFHDSAGTVTPVLSAGAVYRTSSGSTDAVWFDSRGIRIEIRWEATDSVLVSNWTAPAESGRTTYRVMSADQVEVLDEVRSAAGWRTFGSARYERVRRQAARRRDGPIQAHGADRRGE
jgi:hypothetical protein